MNEILQAATRLSLLNGKMIEIISHDLQGLLANNNRLYEAFSTVNDNEKMVLVRHNMEVLSGALALVKKMQSIGVIEEHIVLRNKVKIYKGDYARLIYPDFTMVPVLILSLDVRRNIVSIENPQGKVMNVNPTFLIKEANNEKDSKTIDIVAEQKFKTQQNSSRYKNKKIVRTVSKNEFRLTNSD